MSIDAVNQSRATWGTAYSGKAAGFAGQDDQGFDDTLKSSVGFGSRGESGGVTNSIAAATNAADDLVSQLQYSLLKSSSSDGVSSRLNNALF